MNRSSASSCRGSLSQAYDFKTVADYEIGPDATVPLPEAMSAIEAAQRFIDRIDELLE
jgi:hypothetical protein